MSREFQVVFTISFFVGNNVYIQMTIFNLIKSISFRSSLSQFYLWRTSGEHLYFSRPYLVNSEKQLNVNRLVHPLLHSAVSQAEENLFNSVLRCLNVSLYSLNLDPEANIFRFKTIENRIYREELKESLGMNFFSPFSA